MGVDAGGLVVAVISVGVSVLFTLWFTRQQTNAARKQAAAATEQVAIARDQAVAARDAAETAQRQLALAEQVRREQIEPYVIVDIRPSDHVANVFLLIIENIGPTVARNVRIHFEPPLERVIESQPHGPTKLLKESVLLTQGIPMMPPGRRMEWYLDVTHERFASGLPMQYTVTVDADGPVDRVETMIYKIDLTVYDTVRRLNVRGVHDAVKAMEGLAKATNKVADKLARSTPSEPLVDFDQVEAGDE